MYLCTIGIKSDLESGQSIGGDNPVTAGSKHILHFRQRFASRQGQRWAASYIVIVLGTYVLELSRHPIF
jgi:hypothetical protein